MSVRSARRPLPALIFLLALAILAVVVWIRVSDRAGSTSATASPTCPATASANVLPANGSIGVQVLNANGTDGLATTTLAAFAAAGFHGIGSDNYSGTTPITGVGVVTAGAAGAQQAKVVALYLPGATLATDDRADNSVTITIGPGFTGLATQAVVTAELAKAGLKQAAPPAATPTGSASPRC